MENKDSLRDAWASLGIAFNAKVDACVDPETALIKLVSSGEFSEDKKMMGLALLWLKHFSQLVHVERLKAMAKDLGALELALLGAIARKCIANGDFRFRIIENLAKKKISGSPRFSIGDSETFIKMRGLDPDFNAFGIRVAPIMADNEKKILQRELILKRNLWLKHRVLFGSNLRADIATVISLKLAKSGYAAAKLLKCSPNAAYRNWKALEEVGWGNTGVPG